MTELTTVCYTETEEDAFHVAKADASHTHTQAECGLPNVEPNANIRGYLDGTTLYLTTDGTDPTP